MTAGKIRTWSDALHEHVGQELKKKLDMRDPLLLAQAQMLSEIAAQLAELNGTLQDIQITLQEKING